MEKAEIGNNICREHSGCIADIHHLQESNRDQWTEINGLKNKLTAILAATVLTLVGVIVNLVLSING